MSAVFNEAMTNYTHLPWMEYTQHSNRFPLTLHFFLHRRSEQKRTEEKKKEFLSNTMPLFPYRLSHNLEFMTKTFVHLSSNSTSTNVPLISFLDLFYSSFLPALIFLLT